MAPLIEHQQKKPGNEKKKSFWSAKKQGTIKKMAISRNSSSTCAPPHSSQIYLQTCPITSHKNKAPCQRNR
jgi:hypothetical protein